MSKPNLRHYARQLDMPFVVNDRYIPLLDDKHRHLVIMGGAGSGKSVFSAQKLVVRCKVESGHTFIALRKVGRTVKESVFTELRTQINRHGFAGEFHINLTNRELVHKATGSRIVCMGLDEPEKIKSISGITGMWLEEATEFTEEDLDQLNLRIRGQQKHYVQYLYTFNPIDEDHFLKAKFFDREDPEVLAVRTTYKDNYFLTQEDIRTLMSFKDTNPLYYQIYVLAEWGVQDKSGKFLWAFDKNKHVSEEPREIPRIALRLSFDFNIEPFAVSVYHMLNAHTMHVFGQIRLNDSDIYAVCDRIKATYPGRMYLCTGDASGANSQGTARGKTSYWRIVKQQLQLTDSQIRIRRQNLGLAESRGLCNAALSTRKILIHPRCEELIRDATYAKVDEFGVLVKDRDKNKNDFLDTFRYMLDKEFHTLVPAFTYKQ